MKKLVQLLEKRHLSIASNHTHHFGRYTLVELTDTKGNQSIGLSRCSDMDRPNPELGEKIARGRAEHALYNKLKGKQVQTHYMG